MARWQNWVPAFAGMTMMVVAQAMEPLTDAALSQVRGRDGMSFNLNNFSMQGDATLRYYNGAGTASLSIGNLAVSRSDNTDAPFADPYLLDVVSGGSGRADVISLARPINAAGRELWQIAYDFGINEKTGGSIAIKDLAYYGGGMQWTTPHNAGDGLAFGYALRANIGSVSWLPNGRNAGGEAMVLSGVRIGSADDNSPWRIADVGNQQGIFNARTDEQGNSRLHLGINWAETVPAPTGAISIDNITFRSAAGNVDLGASRIGGIQVQYLDIKFRP